MINSPDAPATGSEVIPARLYRYRRPIIAVIELGLIVFSQFAACWLRFDGDIPDWVSELEWQTLPWLVLIRGLLFLPFRLYEGLWRYTSLWDLRNLIGGVLASSAAFFAVTVWVLQYRLFPRSVYFIDTLVLIFLLGGIRLTRRLYRDVYHVRNLRRVLIVGAGDAGEMIVREMKHSRYYDGEPVGFVDDDPDKVGRRIHGVRVLGTSRSLASILDQTKPDEVLIAIPSGQPHVIRAFVRALEPYKIPIKTLPNLREILDGSVAATQIRSLRIEDLLSRAPVGLADAPVRTLISSRRVLITGAGGSIGSELARQVAALEPSQLTLLDRYENGLHAIYEDLREKHRALALEPSIADVTDQARLEAVFALARPDIVFHAAAHKHVPLMEFNPCEAVKNNVRGTRIVAQVAVAYDVERFILISSDKAVNPTSVMGATKSVAEQIVEEVGRQGKTRCVAVRFGNVLASNGSVVPKFLRQISTGGPVTVTHPEMRRFFMLIPEAVQLVLHAATLADRGGLFVLEMGEQLRLVDLARDLIRLSGLVPEEDIAITFTGLRPGEKLFEELAGSEEWLESSGVEKILRVARRSHEAPADFWNNVARLEGGARDGSWASSTEVLRAMVPSFHFGSQVEGSRRSDPLEAIRRSGDELASIK